MKATKKVIGSLNKCYSLSPITVEGQPCFLVAAEKQDPCYLFSEQGEKLETVWEQPGGVMTMAPVPNRENAFLATHQFYSPNDSKNAKIIICERRGKDDWQVRTLCQAPFVHRFGILQQNGVHYLLVCCLKSDHEYKDDWRSPGACYAAVLPEDLSGFDDSHPLQLTKIYDNMLRNHGFSLLQKDGYDAAVVGCEQGSFLFCPPEHKDGAWQIQTLLSVPTSDSVLVDFDGDGKLELGCIAPFHGASLVIYHLDEFGNYVPCWKLPLPERDTEMLHATWACTLGGKPTWVVGWRKGTRGTIAIYYDSAAGEYRFAYIDQNAGCANALQFVNRAGEQILLATNREIDEIAMYTIEEGE